MRALWVLVLMRLRDVARSKSGVFFYVMLPLLLLAVVGVSFWNGHPFEKKRVVVLDQRPEVHGALAIYSELELVDVATPQVALGMLRSRLAAAVVTPDPDGIRVVVGQRDLLFGKGLAESLPSARLKVEQLPRWGYVHYLIPGLLMFSSLLSGFFGIGYPMVRYRQHLFLKKLATTPLPKSAFIASQLLARTAVALGQSGLMLVAAHLAFDFPLPLGALPWLVVLLTLSILVFMGLGFLLACFIYNDVSMLDAINVSTMPFVFLSEIFFPADALPGALSVVAGLLPSTQMVRLLRAVLLFDQHDLAALGPGIGVVVVWLALSFLVSLVAFRWHDGLGWGGEHASSSPTGRRAGDPRADGAGAHAPGLRGGSEGHAVVEQATR